jgi:hypothetical protein
MRPGLKPFRRSGGQICWQMVSIGRVARRVHDRAQQLVINVPLLVAAWGQGPARQRPRMNDLAFAIRSGRTTRTGYDQPISSAGLSGQNPTGASACLMESCPDREDRTARL